MGCWPPRNKNEVEVLDNINEVGVQNNINEVGVQNNINEVGVPNNINELGAQNNINEVGVPNNINEVEIPKNLFACPECGEFDPVISKINVDNKKIEFCCKKCAEKEYKSKYFTSERKLNNITYYLTPKNGNGEIQYFFKEYRKNERQENKKSFLKKIFQRKLENAKEIIKKKNEQLKKIIKFNNMVKHTSEKYQKNYFHLKSLKNISNSLQKEILRDSNDLKFLLEVFNNEIQFSDKAIKVFNKAANVDIKREEESLFLSKKKLKDINIISLSMIKFNQLKEIDLSENEIKDIEPISKMILPFLEFLNLSFNKINNIKPLGEMNSKKLKYLFIQNNQIEDIQFIKNWDFPKLIILRLENNDNINENSDSFKKIVNDYKKNKHIIVTKKKIEEIENLYNIKYDDKTKKIELEGVKKEDEEDELMLINLFIIISQKSENSISKLKLTNCKIKDPSILKRIQFNLLYELDLSFNNIKDLKFLKGMKAKDLKKLYLNNNNIKDLSLLNKIRDLFPYLQEIFLNNNNFNPENQVDLVNYLDQEEIKLNIN